jgi:hypothetical protein
MRPLLLTSLLLCAACKPKPPPAISCVTPEEHVGSVEAYAIDEHGVRTMPYRFTKSEHRIATLHLIDKTHLWAPEDDPLPNVQDVLFLENAEYKFVSVTYLERGDDGKWHSRADLLTCTPAPPAK